MAKTKQQTPIDDVKPETFYPSEIVAIDTLRPWPRNYKDHPESQTEVIGQGLKDFGQFKNIVVWRGPGDDFDYIVAGHGLVESAKSAGWGNVEVKRLPSDWSIVQVEAALVADNVTAELSVTNTEKLANLLQSIRQENPRMLAPTGYDSEKVDAMLRGLAGIGEPGAGAGGESGGAGKDEIPTQWAIMITCDSELQQADLLEKFAEDGLQCRALIS